MKMMRVVALLAGVSVMVGLAAASAQTIKIDKSNRVIEVSGLGTASAEPDVAQVHVVSTYGATLWRRTRTVRICRTEW